ncbi:IclR family transcriptional regulator [Aliiruegeria haliotis]|uniref:IclR family transcriptional regulator n=1 Tax=Aliiruegeria haliotis TaxID=1280846 RepID=A0A2T0RVH4_9RHOB|nr:IclR family transcriptional regulator [Aliiruegeria haliotis]PRY25181.1 IclR family transcriptional regulator [Aliiruegeria haliotis]
MRISEKPGAGVVQSVDRALALLEALAESDGGARLSDVARDLGLPVSTVHRLLTTMQMRGFAHHEPHSGRWVIGHRAFSVGETFAHHANLVGPARPILRALRDMTRETANLGVLESEEAVTIAQAESREIKRAIAPPGGRVPILNSGMGKAIIATWPDEAIRNLVERQGLRPMTSRSLGSLEEVMEEISRVRDMGYAVDNEEFVSGMRCVAAVVWSANGEPVAAISVSGLAARVTVARVPEFAGSVVQKAAELSKAISGAA